MLYKKCFNSLKKKIKIEANNKIIKHLYEYEYFMFTIFNFLI